MKPAHRTAWCVALSLCAAGHDARAWHRSDAPRERRRYASAPQGSDWAVSPSTPALWTDVEAAAHIMPLGGLVFPMPATAGSPAYTVSAAQVAPRTTMLFGANARVAWQVHRVVYFGFGAGYAGGALDASSLVDAGPLRLQPLSIAATYGAATVGVAASSGRVSARLELAAGVRNLALSATQLFREQRAAAESDVLQPYLEPHLAVDFWVASGVTLGVWGGVELAPGSPVGAVGGVSIATHARPLDGTHGR